MVLIEPISEELEVLVVASDMPVRAVRVSFILIPSHRLTLPVELPPELLAS